MKEKYIVNKVVTAFIVLEANDNGQAIEVAKQIAEEYWEYRTVEWDAYITTMDVTEGLELD